ncbi:hypothetical protein CTRI78_v006355 [Colletotrichum trifolii]|uniref:Uncharacterized protein n=1 Tax=Colletotrichum trifolii TaxID=5466 RepID=A0A4R8RCN6_COLTR|nr:hypothetical protein CTRI78_v006355 [Colletotrichum trifolii]
MGLALHNSSDALDTFPRGIPQVTALPTFGTQYQESYPGADGTLPSSRELSNFESPLLNLVLLADHQNRPLTRRTTHTRHHNQRRWCCDGVTESSVQSAVQPRKEPPEHRRTPSLERQGAFRAKRTNKRCITRNGDGSILPTDEFIHGDDLRLEINPRRELEHSMGTAKSSQRSRMLQGSFEGDFQIALHLSLAELGRDRELARLLLSCEESDGLSDGGCACDPQVSRLINYAPNDIPDLVDSSDPCQERFRSLAGGESSTPTFSTGRWRSRRLPGGHVF